MQIFHCIVLYCILKFGYAETHLCSLYSTLQAAGGRGSDVCDDVFEGDPGKCDEGEEGVIFFLKSRDIIYGRPRIPFATDTCKLQSPK